MVLLDPDAFLTQFTRILEKSRAKGTIYVTLKRYAGKEGKNVDAVDPADCRCLVRAVGSKQKISCMLAAKDYRFMKAYGNIPRFARRAQEAREEEDREEEGEGGGVDDRRGRDGGGGAAGARWAGRAVGARRAGARWARDGAAV